MSHFPVTSSVYSGSVLLLFIDRDGATFRRLEIVVPSGRFLGAALGMIRYEHTRGVLCILGIGMK